MPPTAPLIRGGGPATEPIGDGQVYKRQVRFKLSTPGRYVVMASSRYRALREQKPSQRESVPDVGLVVLTTPGIELTVK